VVCYVFSVIKVSVLQIHLSHSSFLIPHIAFLLKNQYFEKKNNNNYLQAASVGLSRGAQVAAARTSLLEAAAAERLIAAAESGDTSRIEAALRDGRALVASAHIALHESGSGGVEEGNNNNNNSESSDSDQASRLSNTPSAHSRSSSLSTATPSSEPSAASSREASKEALNGQINGQINGSLKGDLINSRTQADSMSSKHALKDLPQTFASISVGDGLVIGVKRRSLVLLEEAIQRAEAALVQKETTVAERRRFDNACLS